MRIVCDFVVVFMIEDKGVLCFVVKIIENKDRVERFREFNLIFYYYLGGNIKFNF